LREAFGDRIFDDEDLAFKAVLLCLETFQQTPQEFYPYSSKYDAWLRHQATLTSAESRGLEDFNDPGQRELRPMSSERHAGGCFPAVH
jgi:cytochrome c peroxidase